ncbi:MAG: helix-turn-helix domain-containing protein [Thermoanaerobaculia bacterium]
MKRNLNRKLGKLVNELAGKGLTLNQVSKEFEKQFILATLRKNDGNLSRSAQHLGIHRNTLRNKVGSLDIQPSDYLAPSRRRPGRQSRPRARN